MNGAWPAAIDTVYHSGNDQTVAQFRLENAAAGATTITATGASGLGNFGLRVQELGGAKTPTALDGHAGQAQTAVATGTDVLSSGATSNAAQPAFMVALSMCVSDSFLADPGTGFTDDGSGWGGFCRQESRAVTTTGSAEARFSAAATRDWVTLVAIYDDAAGAGPTIDTHPQSQLRSLGSTATLTVSGTSSGGPLHYEWQRLSGSWGAISGAPDSNTYTTGALTLADDGAQIRCVVTDNNGSATSNAATLNVGIQWRSAGAIAYSAASGTSDAPGYPTGIQEGDALLLLVGQKPSTANGGTVTTPAGWTALPSLTGAGGYGTTLTSDQGNTNLFAYWKAATGSETGTLSVTVGTNNVCWAIILRLSCASKNWEIAGVTGSDSTAGSVSIPFASDPGVQTGDLVVVAMCTPTDINAGANFSAESVAQTGVTFGTVVELLEPQSGNGNDIGGFILRTIAAAGTSSAAPTVTATPTTTTNARGPGVFVRLREVATAAYSLTAGSASTALGGQAASLKAARKLAGQRASITLAGQAASIRRGIRLPSAPGTIAVSGRAATLLYTPASGYSLAAQAAVASVAGQSAALRVARRLAASGAAVALGSQAAALKAQRRLAAAVGSVSAPGQPALLKAQRRLVAATAIVTVTGRPTGTTAPRLAAGLANVAAVGLAASLRLQRRLTAAPAVALGSGKSASFSLARRLTAAVAPISLAGQPTQLRRAARLLANRGAVEAHGQSVALSLSRYLAAAAGVALVAGQLAALSRSYRLEPEWATVAVVGQNAALTHRSSIVLLTVAIEASSYSVVAESNSFSASVSERPYSVLVETP